MVGSITRLTSQITKYDTLDFFDHSSSLKYASITMLNHAIEDSMISLDHRILVIPKTNHGLQYDILLTQRRLETAMAYLCAINSDDSTLIDDNTLDISSRTVSFICERSDPNANYSSK